MKRANIHDAKTNLSKYLEDVRRGETIIICNHNEPVAELRALPKQRTSPRPWGIDQGLFSVPADWNAPLDEHELALWEP